MSGILQLLLLLDWTQIVWSEAQVELRQIQRLRVTDVVVLQFEDESAQSAVLWVSYPVDLACLVMGQLIELECEREGRPDPQFGFDANLSIELRADGLADVEAQANPLRVELVAVFDEAIELEQVLLIVLADSDTGVTDLHLDGSMRSGLLKVAAVDGDRASSRGEL